MPPLSHKDKATTFRELGLLRRGHEFYEINAFYKKQGAVQIGAQTDYVPQAEAELDAMLTTPEVIRVEIHASGSTGAGNWYFVTTLIRRKDGKNLWDVEVDDDTDEEEEEVS